jgi:molybdopterin synthase catalytic subunit
VLSFVGTVRDEKHGRRHRNRLRGYPPMALRVLERMAPRSWRCMIATRRDRAPRRLVAVGDASVAIVVASAHRRG